MTRPPTHAAEPPDAAGWRRIAWRLYAHLPRAADAPLRLVTRATLPIANRRVALTVLHGPTATGGEGRVLFAGAPTAAAWLASRFFAAPPARAPLGSIPIWSIAAALARHRDTVDLVVARVDRVSAALALHATPVAVPEWVGTHVPVPTDVATACRRRKSLAHNLTRMRRAGFVPEVSHGAADFAAFYDRMYVPFVERRHGDATVVTHRSRLRRCFRQGGVMWVRRGTERVAGLLFRVRGGTLDLVVIGTAEGALDPLHEGAAFALDVFLFEHARRLGCTTVDFGGSRPSPRDGLLVYKARWDGVVVPNRTTFYDLRLGWQRLTPPVLDFLARTPLIVRQADGFAALWGPASDADLRAARSVARSLRRTYVLRADAGSADAGIVRVDPAADPGWHPPFAADR